jgi:hypothetical protein
MAGVRPVDQAGVSSKRGPGSENRTRFLAFFGVLAANLCMSGTASPITLFLVRCETGELLLESEMELLLRLRADCRVSIVNMQYPAAVESKNCIEYAPMYKVVQPLLNLRM